MGATPCASTLSNLVAIGSVAWACRNGHRDQPGHVKFVCYVDCVTCVFMLPDTNARFALATSLLGGFAIGPPCGCSGAPSISRERQRYRCHHATPQLSRFLVAHALWSVKF